MKLIIYRWVIAWGIVGLILYPAMTQAQFGRSNNSQDFFQQGQFELDQEIRRLQKDPEAENQEEEPLVIKDKPEVDNDTLTSPEAEIEEVDNEVLRFPHR